MDKVLITGGAGYIGSILVPELLRRKYKVTVIDNFLYQQTSLAEVCADPNFQIIRGDVRDDKLLENETKKADILIPLACLTGAPICAKDPVAAQQINYDAVVRMANWKTKSQQMIFPSTNSGYGVGEAGIFCDEGTPLRPVSLYGKLKVDLETKLLERGDVVTFRFATVFGMSPRMRLDLLVNDFVYRAVVDRALVVFEPHFKRNFLHIRDAASAFLHAIENFAMMQGKPFNVGLSDANFSKLELCEVIRKLLPDFRFVISDSGEDPDKRNYIVSNARIEATGFRTQYSLPDGIHELVKGYQILRRNQFGNI